MRALPVITTCFVFDFDDTLVVTDARIKIYRNKAFLRALTPKEFNVYKLKKGEVYDFREFDDREHILNAKKYKMWPTLKKVNNSIKEGKPAFIYILTARGNVTKAYIYEFLKRNGIEIDMHHILTVGDHHPTSSVSVEKHQALTKLVSEYSKVFFFDDDRKNIELAGTVQGVIPMLVETLK